MNSIDALIYGAIQGLSEFLPVSSSGHLALLPYVIHIKDPGVVFDLMMHFGTALAVIVYFRREIMQYLRTLKPSLFNLKRGGPGEWFVRNFLFSTIVSVGLIVALMPVAKMARNPYFIVFNLCVFGLLLWLADKKNKNLSETLVAPMESGMQWKIAALIGAAQALAIFPGVSRSGVTLTMALFLGMKRQEAGSFSFLMSLPIILAGILKEAPGLMNSSGESIHVLFIGVATSFVVGILTIHFFMRLISKINLGVFTIYRWIIAIAMIWLLR